MADKRLMRMILLMIKDLRDPYFQGFAAQIAFYFFLSLVPTILVLSQLLAFFSLSFDSVKFLLEEVASPEIEEMLMGFVSYAPTGTMNLIFILVALWAASKAQFFLSKIANYSITGESAGRGYIRERLRAVQTIVLTLFTIVFSLIIMVYGELIVNLVINTLRDFFDIQYTFKNFWYILRWPVAMGLYLATVSYSYYILPTKKVRFRDILPGSIFAAISMLVVTSGYSVYAKNIANYSLLYGSLASLIAIMMWFYLLGWTLGFGVMINKAYKETKK